VVIADTAHWMEKAVIGLNLCPFAKAVQVKKQIRYVVSTPARRKSCWKTDGRTGSTWPTPIRRKSTPRC
jgi:hypothetical protein